MNMRFLRAYIAEKSGAAAVEMALMVPLLTTLMFGSFELGHYFYTEHKLVKSVRDAARFAARQPEFYAEPCVVRDVDYADSVAAPLVDNVARYGKVEDVGVNDKTIIRGWDDEVLIKIDCPDIGGYSGIYAGKTKMPMVTVSAEVSYPFLFGLTGFDAIDIDVQAASQAAVIGL